MKTDEVNNSLNFVAFISIIIVAIIVVANSRNDLLANV